MDRLAYRRGALVAVGQRGDARNRCVVRRRVPFVRPAAVGVLLAAQPFREPAHGFGDSVLSRVGSRECLQDVGVRGDRRGALVGVGREVVVDLVRPQVVDRLRLSQAREGVQGARGVVRVRGQAGPAGYAGFAELAAQAVHDVRRHIDFDTGVEEGGQDPGVLEHRQRRGDRDGPAVPGLHAFQVPHAGLIRCHGGVSQPRRGRRG